MTNFSPYPRRVFGYYGESRMLDAQIRFILDLLPDDGRFLEIGSSSGTSAAIIADARPRGTVVCVDNFAGAETRTAPALRLLDWRRNQEHCPNMALWVGTLGTLADWLQPSALFDVALVDAAHDFNTTSECLYRAADLL